MGFLCEDQKNGIYLILHSCVSLMEHNADTLTRSDRINFHSYLYASPIGKSSFVLSHWTQLRGVLLVFSFLKSLMRYN